MKKPFVFESDNSELDQVGLESSDDPEATITLQNYGHALQLATCTGPLPLDMTTTQSLPMAGFPMPEGWKGDSADNPNFKTLGKLSPPIMRKIEPSGPAYLAYARRKLKGRTFSEDDRIEALSKVKKIEDNDDGEISEPEDPMMLQRDAKDWKASFPQFPERAHTY